MPSHSQEELLQDNQRKAFALIASALCETAFLQETKPTYERAIAIGRILGADRINLFLLNALAYLPPPPVAHGVPAKAGMCRPADSIGDSKPEPVGRSAATQL